MEQKRSSIQNPQFFPPELPSSVQIHRTIAFGLGQLDALYGDEDVQHMTQYFTILTIAQALQDLYGKSVEIIFQDPSYTTKDIRLILFLCSAATVVESPEASALFDSNTLVFAPYVPFGVSILQICTDIGPPAGIFTDKVLVSDEQRWFNMHDRTSPRVVNMLKGYTRFGFVDHVLDEELVELMGPKQTFWLNGMELYLKRERSASEKNVSGLGDLDRLENWILVTL
jgi:hypothetical protein